MDMAEIGANIRSCRTEKDMTMEELGRDNTWIKDREKKTGHYSHRANHAECRRTGARAFVFSRE